MNNENKICLVNFSNDVFYNIIKYLTINEALKLKLVSKCFYEYFKDDKAYTFNSYINLNNYIKFVRFVNPDKLSIFFLSLLNDEKKVYSNLLFAKGNANFGINRKQLIECDKPFLKKIIFKGEFLRNTNFYDISVLINSHANTLEELCIHGLNDVNCPLFIYYNYSILFDFLSKEILINNFPLKLVTKNNLENIQNRILELSRQNDEVKNIIENKNDINNKIDENFQTNVTNKIKQHLLYEHISIVYNCNKKCVEKIKNYKQKININNYITSLNALKVLNLTGIQSYDMIEMFISIQMPVLNTLNISCYDYFFYFYHMAISVFLYGKGEKKFTEFSNLKNTQNIGRKYIKDEKKNILIDSYACKDFEKNCGNKNDAIHNDKELYGLLKDIDDNLIETHKMLSNFQKRYEQDAICYYEQNIKNNKKKIFFTPAYKDNIYMNNINNPVYYADGSYINYDSDTNNKYMTKSSNICKDKHINDYDKNNEDSSKTNYKNLENYHDILRYTKSDSTVYSTCKSIINVDSFYTIPSNENFSSNSTCLKDTASENMIYDEKKKKKKNNNINRNFNEQNLHTEKKKIKNLKRGGYMWLIENSKYKKNVSIEILYLFKNIIEKEEKKSRKNIISLLYNLKLEHFSLFNYSLSSPFLWLLLLVKNENLKTLCILDLCLPHLLSALTFLEAFLKQNLFNFQGMMRRRRKRLGSIYFKFNDEEEIKFVNQTYSTIINELNRSNFPSNKTKKNKILHIVIYVYNNRKENKQFIKHIRKISRSLWRCNYIVHYTIQYYKYKYFNKYFEIDNLYRDYILNIIMSNHRFNQSASNQNRSSLAHK
ncbi:CG2-related protein, putative [Plasmodium berghei]|uniref:CG2-related protein, putative n=2 Tax=Plasmodium berghei TaxID=5821 RepID=A0A509ASL4_PLABA|nr:CG2-related protein, putative [Plasmodium berghei ANKA]CXJ24729.1 CG2-related protein, putative [Plasmodium berghei]SCM26814.1 CG2-related protein, putative [Plasmodium berghei]SCN28652.1 CG2-related protein, putative [Plasmodium berghei]SCO62866.1 CG2-related protein, putative [Plasmodium berghei]SCO64400.1 CG2-related protein, putative [Plasmodium berghei]|eukprot:XP_034424296.1 CG2-related protein, putative [Plasmodium berghei ANKA]